MGMINYARTFTIAMFSIKVGTRFLLWIKVEWVMFFNNMEIFIIDFFYFIFFWCRGSFGFVNSCLV
jgi:hypothetical protein